MGRFEGESCASYLYIMSLSDILFIVFFFIGFFSSDYAELSDTFLLHGLRTEFKRKATCSVVEPELHDLITCGLSRQLHEFCVKFIKKNHRNVGDYKYFVTFALDYENMN